MIGHRVAYSCLSFKIDPEHSPVLSYMNLTDKDDEIKEQLGQIEALYFQHL